MNKPMSIDDNVLEDAIWESVEAPTQDVPPATETKPTDVVSQVKSLKAAAAKRGIGQKTLVVVKASAIKVRKPKPFEWVRVHPDVTHTPSFSR